MVEKRRCTGCGVCQAVCHRKAITMEQDQEGFFYPKVDGKRCNQCGLCDQVCPQDKTEQWAGENAYFGARAKDEAMRVGSSSGGIFPLLAEYVIENGGVVFGAELREDGKVVHRSVEAREGIGKIAKTKYVQSDLSKIWGEIKESLQKGRQVLFCGTPCQIEAVRAYAGKGRENLCLVSLICYGVPSPGVWAKYVRFLEKKYGGPFQGFSFRDKRVKNYGRTVALQIGNQERSYPMHEDLYLRTYFRNVNIRPCCYQCRYCTVERNSDMTLGDFWGVEQIRPDIDDRMGVSAIICHSDKGKFLWSQIQEKTQWFACQEEDVANPMQPRLKKPTEPAGRRGLYMGLYKWTPFSLWIRLFNR